MATNRLVQVKKRTSRIKIRHFLRRFFSAGLLLFMAFHPLHLQATEKPAIPLIARGDRNFPPYEFINPDGKPDGFNIDLLKAIAKALKMDVDIGLDTWQSVREDFAGGRIHLVTGMIRSAEREKQFDFTITHAGVFYCLFVRKGSPIKTIDDAREKAILVHAEAYSHEWLANRHITSRIITAASPQEALKMLADGRHDCAILERLSALEILADLKIDDIVMAGPPLVCAPYTFAVQKGNDRLLAQLNEGIHRMHQNGVYEDLYRKWFSVADAHARRMALVRVGLLVLAVVVGLAAAGLLSNLALKRIVRRRTADLITSENRFQELCDLLPQTVFETDANGRITFLNRFGFEMLGISTTAPSKDLHLSTFLPGAAYLLEWAQNSDRRGKACVVRGTDSTPFPALFYATPVVSDEKQTGLRGLLVDITFQKELEKQVVDAQKMEALGHLAGGVAHDFNNIVTGISAYAQMIGKQPHDERVVTDSADRILTGCDRASDLVRHFLVTAGRRQPEKQRVRLGTAVAEVFKLLQPTYGATITFDNGITGKNDTVWAEPALVFQILMNLCVNGAQAMADSGGVLTVGLKTGETADDANRRFQRVLYVMDSGPGVDPELKDRIFEPFFTTRRQSNGTGIGLFVVSQALSEMGGAIRVESTPGKGTTFIVHMPAAPPESE